MPLLFSGIMMPLLAALVLASFYPTPPVVTDVQKQVIANQAAKAKDASEAATKAVLEFFDTQAFRSELRQCCPAAALLSSQQLLDRLRAEMKVAELAHSFPAGKGGHFTDMTIAKAKEVDFWLNEWHVPIMDGEKVPALYSLAEENIFGCPPFRDEKHPTWDEASNRMIYIVQNTQQYDFGSRPTFGDASVVFKKSYVRNNVLIAAVDTGLWELACNKSIPKANKSWGVNITCSAWQPQQVGTLDHMDHLILANFASWAVNDTVAHVAGRLFARTPLAGDYLKLQPTNHEENNYYMEANILMNPRLPEGISLLIGDFAALFGTDLGIALQELAQQRGWPLAWARGALSLDSWKPAEKVSPSNERILDPKIGNGQTLNATFPATSTDDFEKLWSAVKEGRSSSAPSHDQFATWWKTLASQQLKVAPVSAYACAELDDCVGLDARSSDCICHVKQQALLV